MDSPSVLSPSRAGPCSASAVARSAGRNDSIASSGGEQQRVPAPEWDLEPRGQEEQHLAARASARSREKAPMPRGEKHRAGTRAGAASVRRVIPWCSRAAGCGRPIVARLAGSLGRPLLSTPGPAQWPAPATPGPARTVSPPTPTHPCHAMPTAWTRARRPGTPPASPFSKSPSRTIRS